jgi:hypothetical protein
MSDECTVASAQAALEEITFELIALQERLESINRRLPVPPDQEAMLEGEIAPDVATELSGCIECVTEHTLREAVEMLQQAASVTAHDLIRDFRKQHKEPRRESR